MKHRAFTSSAIALFGAMLLAQPAAALQGAATDLNRPLDPGYTPPEPDEAEPKPEAPQQRGRTDVAAPVGQASTIQGINFIGSDVPEDVAIVAESYLGRQANVKTLKALAAAMSAAYQDSSVALFSLAIPSQDLSDGVVDVHIAEGYVKNAYVRKDGKVTESKLLSGYMAPVVGQQPTSRSSYERALALSRRVPGYEVKPRLGTTKEQGATNVVLDVEPKKNRFYGGYDNRESRLIDRGRLTAGGVGYNLMREGDQLSGRLSISTDGQQARSAEVSYRSPVGARGTMLDLSAAYQETRPDSLPIEGEATQFSAGLSHPLLLDFKREISTSFRVDHLQSTNAAFGSVLTNDEVTAARVGLTGRKTTKKRAVLGSVTLSQGIDVNSAETSTPGASVDFTKLGLSSRFIQAVGKNVRLNLSASAQWTDDTLPANERLLIGGASFGRGFRNGLVAFDKGYAAIFEPSYRPLRKGDFKQSDIYVFADYGGGSVNNPTSSLQDITLGSAGVGVRFKWKDMTMLGLEMAEPFELPVSGLNDDPIYSVTWSFKYQPGQS
ncbi:MAG: ShlB/FhaC/HecB family hemolysin secretion/activation protein [Alphaproteobacteria bacterium]|nr:ShlB/FhaC/HecB family hemolysin secretion/activation protein [Alphaproteobacteria bacterium]